jgi:hypothetical protein
VIAMAVRLVVEDGLPYRTASCHMPRSARPFGWRDHRVFVPFATIQNRVEASGGTRAESIRHSRVASSRRPRMAATPRMQCAGPLRRH